MDRWLEGKVVIVTGAGGGIDRDMALATAAEGARVDASAITPGNGVR